MGPTLLDTFMNHLDSGTEYALSRAVGATKQMVNMLEGWSVRSLLKLRMTSMKSCILYRITLQKYLEWD